ncbi:hypothetical protein JXO59_02515 [candidate division KSB1 bacterium]|nr:hypothetical protein [candidate division KSB1 bacterium]
MSTIFDDLKEGLRDGLNIVVKKTGEYTKLGKLNIDLIGLRREIEQLFSELGGRTFEIITKEPDVAVKEDEEVKQLVEKLKNLEAKLAQKKVEMTDYKKRE